MTPAAAVGEAAAALEGVPVGILTLDTLEGGLELSHTAEGIAKYRVYLMDARPTGAEDEEGMLIMGGVLIGESLFIPEEKLEAGKYLKVEIREVFFASEWMWYGWKIEARMNYRGSMEEAAAIVDSSRKASDPVQGRIRRVAQNRNDSGFTRDYWENKKYNFVYGGDQLSNSMCTRANYSMALSYLGISITPVEMSTISGSKQVDHNPAAPYDDLTRYLAEQNGVAITRVTGELDELFENYASDSSYSPIYVRMRKKDGNPHVFLVVGRDDDYYYVVDSSSRNGSFVHAIRVNEEGDRILKDRGANCWEKYYNAKITYCHQWKLGE